MAPKVRPGIMDIAPYVGGEADIPGIAKPVKLSSNENPLGPSPKAMAAFREAAVELHRYPDGGAERLREGISRRFGLAKESIVCGNGSDELIALLTRAYAGLGDEVLFSRHGFLMYRLSTLAVGATPRAAPEKNLATDMEALLAMVTPATRIVFLGNPNNPTGSYMTAGLLRELRRRLPADVLLAIDAAYAEFVEADDYDAGEDMVRAGDNTVMLRTFSKIYGLAGLRLGFALAAPDIAARLAAWLGPWAVASPAIAIGEAALADTTWARATRDQLGRESQRLDETLSQAGLERVGGTSLFRLARTPVASELFHHLGRAGILVRRFTEQPDWLRFGLPGGEDAWKRLRIALAAFH